MSKREFLKKITMGKRILTIDEINEVLIEANNPKYEIQNLLHLGRTITSILRISKSKKLILIRGNSETAFDHILERHHPTSKTGFWKHETTLETPSKFSLSTIPIYDFLHVAESIFEEQNLINDVRNKRQDLFDLYIGQHADSQNKLADYKLLLYKGTKIIHSLFPIKRTFNRKKVINLQQGNTSSISYDREGINMFYIPYFDEKNIEKFKIILRQHMSLATEKWYIQINTNTGEPFATYFAEERSINSYLRSPFRLTRLDFIEDLSRLEKIIGRILKGEIKID